MLASVSLSGSDHAPSVFRCYLFSFLPLFVLLLLCMGVCVVLVFLLLCSGGRLATQNHRGKEKEKERKGRPNNNNDVGESIWYMHAARAIELA